MKKLKLKLVKNTGRDLPPKHLTDEQKKTWRQLVKQVPAGVLSGVYFKIILIYSFTSIYVFPDPADDLYKRKGICYKREIPSEKSSSFSSFSEFRI